MLKVLVVFTLGSVTGLVTFSHVLSYILKHYKSITTASIIGFIIGFLALHVALFFVALYTPWLFIWALTGTILRLLVDHRSGVYDPAWRSAALQEKKGKMAE